MDSITKMLHSHKCRVHKVKIYSNSLFATLIHFESSAKVIASMAFVNFRQLRFAKINAEIVENGAFFCCSSLEEVLSKKL